MNDIAEIVNILDPAEQKAFKQFVARQSAANNPKSLELLKILLDTRLHKAAHITRELYQKPNNEAYQALRKSLMRHLINFITIKQFNEGSDVQQRVNGTLQLARFLFEQNKNKLAWKYLLKAEKLANEFEMYELLQMIYLLQVENASKQNLTDIADLLEKYERARALASRDARVSIALAIVRFKLQQMRLSGRLIDFGPVLEQVTREYKLEDDYLRSPKLFFQFMGIFRSAVIAGKEYHSFEPFLIDKYKQFAQLVHFRPQDLEYRTGILYMLAHTLYRNKKFTASLQFLNQMEECFNVGNKAIFNQYYSRYKQLRSNSLFFTGRAEVAIAETIQILAKRNLLTDNADRLNIQLNLAFFYFFAGQPSAANKVLNEINFSDNRIVRLMGAEWLMRKELFEVIVQYELENFDVVQSRIKSIKTGYQGFINQAPFIRIFTFLDLINQTIEEPDILQTSEFFDKVEHSFTWLPVEQEDIPAVLYYAWFSARMTGQNPYDSLLALMAKAPQDYEVK